MASKQMVAVLAVVVAVLPAVAMATQFVVGDEVGWSLKGNYTAWAEGKMFYVGDSLVFKYSPGKHNVLKVNGADFKACSTGAPLGTLKSGNDVVTLSAAGRKWYICGVPGHCDGGMKLVINVLSSLEGPAGPPSTPPAANRATAAAAVHGMTFFALAAAVLVMLVMV